MSYANDVHIVDTALSKRAKTALTTEDYIPIYSKNPQKPLVYVTVGEVRRASDEELRGVYGLGERTLLEIRKVLGYEKTT